MTISRAHGSVTYPANFLLVGAMNPCPCGYFGDTRRECTYSSRLINRYGKWLAGFLLDDPADPLFITWFSAGSPTSSPTSMGNPVRPR